MAKHVQFIPQPDCQGTSFQPDTDKSGYVLPKPGSDHFRTGCDHILSGGLACVINNANCCQFLRDIQCGILRYGSSPLATVQRTIHQQDQSGELPRKKPEARRCPPITLSGPVVNSKRIEVTNHAFPRLTKPATSARDKVGPLFLASSIAACDGKFSVSE